MQGGGIAWFYTLRSPTQFHQISRFVSFTVYPKHANVPLDPSHSNEYKFFNLLRKELKGSQNNYDPIKNYQIKELRKMIKLVMERIENI